MKRFFTLLSTIVVISTYAQQTETFVQYSNPENFNNTSPACEGEFPGDSYINHNGRVFDLSNYAINTPFTLTKVDVFGTGMEGASVKVRAAIVTGDPSVPGDLNVTDAFGEYIYNTTLSDSWVSIQMSNTYTFAGNSQFAVAIEHKYIHSGIRFFIGNNNTAQNPETSPSYMGFPGSQCGSNQAMIEIGNAYPVSWLFSVTGEVEGMGTVELGSKSLSVYPNPVSDVLNINMANGKTAQSIEIVNLAGQSVFTSKAANTVNVNFLASGVYIVRVKDNNGITHMSKIVKK